jgi:LysM repeat protein
VVAKKGDSFESIGKVFNISPNMLRRFNDVAKGEQLSKSDIVYIEPKQKQWHGNKMQHVVTKGENLYSISQLYGIKMKSLCKLNKIAKGGDVKRGDIVQLQ